MPLFAVDARWTIRLSTLEIGKQKAKSFWVSLFNANRSIVHSFIQVIIVFEMKSIIMIFPFIYFIHLRSKHCELQYWDLIRVLQNVLGSSRNSHYSYKKHLVLCQSRLFTSSSRVLNMRAAKASRPNMATKWQTLLKTKKFTNILTTSVQENTKLRGFNIYKTSRWIQLSGRLRHIHVGKLKCRLR